MLRQDTESRFDVEDLAILYAATNEAISYRISREHSASFHTVQSIKIPWPQDLWQDPLPEIEIVTSHQEASMSASPFLCPGSSQTVTRAVHLARLNAGWPTCDQCEWRFDSEGMAEKSQLSAERIRGHRTAGIRRTEFGVRGPYLNELDRRTTADLARLFAVSLHNDLQERLLAEPDAEISSLRSSRLNSKTANTVAEQQPVLAERSSLVVGFDGRSSSTDIFVGVTAAIRELGLSLIDIGRTTAATIQEAARSMSGCAGAVFVTGANFPAAWTGLDVSDSNGDPVPVIWKDFGIRLHHVIDDATQTPEQRRADPGESSDSRLSEMLHRVRSPLQTTVAASRSSSNLRLEMPTIDDRRKWPSRLSRTSGDHSAIDFEPRYREWLTRWYPQKQSLRIQVRSDDVVIQQRVAWLAETTGLELLARPIHAEATLPASVLTMTIAEDDRHFELRDSGGVPISPDKLASLINTAIQSKSSQITAHADAASGRFWLTDARSLPGPVTTLHLRDALATLGLISCLIASGRLFSVSGC